MQAYLPWIWLALIVLFGIFEGITVQLVSIWFCVGAFAALLVSFVSPSPVVQLVVFVLVSALALIFSRPLFLRRMKPRRPATNADMVLGQEGVVLTPITEGQVGRVKVDGQDWAARCETPLEAGARCRVERITGVTLTVTPCKTKNEEESVCL